MILYNTAELAGAGDRSQCETDSAVIKINCICSYCIVLYILYIYSV